MPVPIASSLRRSLVLTVAAVATALLLAGCFNLSSELTVRPDGSGTVSERMMVSPQFAQMMKSMQAASDSASDDLFSEADLRARADTIPGLRVQSVNLISSMEGEGYEVVYAFDDLGDVSFAPGPEAPMMTEEGGDGLNPFDMLSSLEYEFEPGSPATLTINMPRDDEELDEADELAEEASGDAGAEEDGEESDTMSSSELGMLRQMVRDTRIRIAVTVDGEIVETNAQHRSGSTITLVDMDFGTLVQDTSAFRRMMEFSERADDLANQEAAADTINAFPGITFESNETVRVRFR